MGLRPPGRGRGGGEDSAGDGRPTRFRASSTSSTVHPGRARNGHPSTRRPWRGPKKQQPQEAVGSPRLGVRDAGRKGIAYNGQPRPARADAGQPVRAEAEGEGGGGRRFMESKT